MPRRSIIFLTLLLLLAGVGLYWGWQLFWFLTDDAYIAFRYISNSYLGYGYVWNAAPFRPVEGYTSFLWVFLLDGLWRLTGLDPTRTANPVSLLCAYGTTLLGVRMLLKLRLKPALAPYRLGFLALGLLGVLTNRTYLAWTSSGLETALFNVLFVAWVAVGLYSDQRHLRTHLGLASLAALTALTRPDGLLCLAATLALNGLALFKNRRPQWLWPFAPYALNLAHLLWRKAFYGDWLPNTYAAKYVAAWPESGLRYLLAFIIEYGLWVWIGLALAYGFSRIFQGIAGFRPWPRPQTLDQLSTILAPTIIVGTLAAHLGYYTFIIGGDHFEFRIYSHLPILLAVGLVWLLNTLRLKPGWALALNLIFILGSWPVQWTAWTAFTLQNNENEYFRLKAPIAPLWPEWARPYAQWYDDLEYWLIEHGVGTRYHEHKKFALHQLAAMPTRAESLRLAPSARAVLIEGAVGVMGWVLPTVSVIDWHGLNDYVVARHPTTPGQPRYMAHDRNPPAGYPECFQANFRANYHRFIVAQRAPDNFATFIHDCEYQHWPFAPFDLNRSVPNLALAPDVGPFIENLWSPDTLYIHYIPPEQTPPQSFNEIVNTFARGYAGAGCVVLPADNAYGLAFLPPQPRPPLATVHTLFPWTAIVTETRFAPAPLAYQLVYAAPRDADQAIAQPPLAHIQSWGAIRLLGYALPQPTIKAGEALNLTLYYHIDSVPTVSAGLFVQVANPAHPEAPITQPFDDVCNSGFTTPQFTPGMLVARQLSIPIPPETPVGNYPISVGLFEWATGDPLPVDTTAPLAMLQIQ
jgi:arabinofuranosyltransferase